MLARERNRGGSAVHCISQAARGRERWHPPAMTLSDAAPRATAYRTLFVTPDRYTEQAKSRSAAAVAPYTSGMAVRKITSPAWQVPLTVRACALFPAASSLW